MASFEAPGLSSFKDTLAALEALGEPTRLRLAALLAEAELTVTELTTILGQSQPRISRHLKLLVDANLVERHREGAWAFFSLQEAGSVRLVRAALAALDPDDAVLVADRTRLSEVRLERTRTADGYFARHAGDWDRLRALHASDTQVETALLSAVGDGPFRAVLDLGTGTGRMLTLLAARADRAVGVDANAAMLSVARANIERAGLRNAQVRQGDIYALPIERDGYDVVIIHQVLHYLDDPARALREAARTIRPGGRTAGHRFRPARSRIPPRGTCPSPPRLQPRDEIAQALLDEGLGEALDDRRATAIRAPSRLSRSRQARDPFRILDVRNRDAGAIHFRRTAFEPGLEIAMMDARHFPQEPRHRHARQAQASPSNSFRRRRRRWRSTLWESIQKLAPLGPELRVRHLWCGRLDT